MPSKMECSEYFKKYGAVHPEQLKKDDAEAMAAFKHSAEVLGIPNDMFPEVQQPEPEPEPEPVP